MTSTGHPKNAEAPVVDEKATEDKRPKHSISVLIGDDCKRKTTDKPGTYSQVNRTGTRSAFKEVHKEKFRYNPLQKPPNVVKNSSEREAVFEGIPPRMLHTPYSVLVGSDDTKRSSWLPSRAKQETRYAHPSVLAGLLEPHAGVTFPYGTLPYYPRATGFYFRDPVSLAAHNCCAKCGMQFRMTSDLVYHMRTHHHKRDKTAERSLQQRATPDKYRCTVCRESFKEKHHLSRHMTSHDAYNSPGSKVTIYTYMKGTSSSPGQFLKLSPL